MNTPLPTERAMLVATSGGFTAAVAEPCPTPGSAFSLMLSAAHRGMGMWLLGAILCATLALGCGSKNSAAGARLEGAVTLDGNPIAEGTLQFVPQQPSKEAPVMVPFKGGRYVAPAIPLGKVRVVVSATKKTGKMIKVYSEPYPEVISIIPEKYQDGIEINVTGNNASQNFEIKSR